LIANSGKFARTADVLCRADACVAREPDRVTHASPRQGAFQRFLAFSDWLYARAGQRTHGIALGDLTLFLRQYLVDVAKLDAGLIDETLKLDHNPRRKSADLPKRQTQHLTPS